MGTPGLAEALAKSNDRICQHMNEDHSKSLLAYAHFYAKMPDATAATLTAMTPAGFVLSIIQADGTEKEGVLIPYPTPLKSAREIRKVAVAMHFEAFNGLWTHMQ